MQICSFPQVIASITGMLQGLETSKDLICTGIITKFVKLCTFIAE